MGKMKIIQVNPGPIPIPPTNYGAIERHIYYLYNNLKKIGVDVKIVNANPPGSQYKSIIKILKDLRREDFDLVHTHGSFVSGIVSPLYPSVFTSHTPAWVSEKDIRDHWGMLWETMAVKTSRGVIALTPQIEKEMERFKPKKIRVIPNGVDCNKYHPDFSKRTGKRIVSVGKIVPHKNFHVLAKATKNTNYEVIFIGKPENREYINLLKKINPKIKFMFNVSDEELINVLSTSDLYVHPSKKEALSIAVLEAMACGLPILGSEMCQFQVVEGTNGFIVKKEEDYEKMIRYMMEDKSLLIKMGKESRKLAEQNYDWPVIAEKVKEYYQEIIK